MRWQDIENDKEKYAAYLCSREWCEKREKVRERSGGICERCKALPMDACHHLTYERKYSERLDDLQAICTPCHEFTHGKADIDPISNTPLKLFGREIRTIYFAGKFGTSAWRETIFYGNRVSAVREDGSCTMRVNGKHVKVIGPRYVEFHEHSGKGVGAHNCATHECNHGSELATPRAQCFNERFEELRSADLVFAWISCRSAFGTLVELGLSYGDSFGSLMAGTANSTVRAVAFKSHDLLDDMWFAAETCSWIGVGDSPAEVWRDMWSGKQSCIGAFDWIKRQNGF